MDEFTTISTSWRHRELESLHKRLGKTDKDRAKERIKIKRKEASINGEQNGYTNITSLYHNYSSRWTIHLYSNLFSSSSNSPKSCYGRVYINL